MANQFALNHLLALRLSGRDAESFFNSQFTLAADSLRSNIWQPIAWCDPKGRVTATMMALMSENDVELALPANQFDAVVKKLRMFTIGREVSLSESLPVAGRLEGQCGEAVLSVDESRSMRAGKPADRDDRALNRWQRLDFCTGLPWMTPETSGQHLPQWLGLDALGAVAYDKGCYPGQEVIARLHYRGTVKYGLRGLVFDSSDDIAAQSPVHDESGRPAGHCLQSLEIEVGRIGLAVLSTRIEPDARVAVHSGGREHPARVTLPEALC